MNENQFGTNPDLVEEYPREYEFTQFEKIKVAAKRAKDLHNLDKAPMVISDRKAPYVALEEMKEGMIKTVYREIDEETLTAIPEDSEENE